MMSASAGNNQAQPLLIGLDGSGALRCGSRVVATGVRSFGVHWSAPGGAVAAGSDAPNVSLATAAAAAAAWDAKAGDNREGSSASSFAGAAVGGAAVPRVVYVTLADELRVAELSDLVGGAGGGRSGGGMMDATAAAGAGTGAVSAMASAAGGKRRDGASRGTGGGVYMDQLHVSMRAAMRPADASRGADSRTRRVEEGARIVASPPGGVNVILQMPRGNLETVAPRFLALPAVAAALRRRRFSAAATLGKDRPFLPPIDDPYHIQAPPQHFPSAFFTSVIRASHHSLLTLSA